MEMNILSKSWTKDYLPKRILAIRLQAMGDVVITLPYLQQLRNALPPNTRLDLLTREETESIPKNLKLFNKVYSIGGGRNFKKQLLCTFFLLPKLFFRRYDVVIDLQDNIISRSVMKLLLPKAWSVFDRLSPVAAGERTRCTIEAIGFGKCFADSSFKLINKNEGIDLLKRNGWNTKYDLVILNPAGAFETRNWKMFNYVRFAELLLEHFPSTQFLIIGTDFIRNKADYLEKKLGYNVINLVNKTTPAQAFSVIQNAKFILSEDSGLMHMAWVSGIPTIALFGSTQSVKAKPLGDHTIFFDSSDLECGSCMREHCKYGDTHCLSRYSAEMIYEKAMFLLKQNIRADVK
jgi:lipopolysaccharide heptosyltransferase II